MQKTIDVIYEDGVFKPIRKVKLPEHAKLTITVLEEDTNSVLLARKQSEALLSLAGLWAGEDRNISENVDRYLYGEYRK